MLFRFFDAFGLAAVAFYLLAAIALVMIVTRFILPPGWLFIDDEECEDEE